MSSIAALTGEVGQVDYAAANACLDSFAVSNLLPSKFTVSINWNTWQNIGMASGSKLPVDISFDERNNFISPNQGEKLFLEIMESAYQNVVISNYNLNEYQCNLTQNHYHLSKNHTKIQRNQLNTNTDYHEPTNTTEKKLAKLWEENLGIDKISIDDNYFNLGGHSLKALKLIEQINTFFNCTISIQGLYEKPTIKEFTTLMIKNDNNDPKTLILLKNSRKNPPYLFLFHPISGLLNCFDSLINHWKHSMSVYGFQDEIHKKNKYKDIDSIVDMYFSQIMKLEPKGPYYLLGYSFGGVIAHGIAHRLLKNNKQVKLLCLIDSWCVFSKSQLNEVCFKKIFKSGHKELPDTIINHAWETMSLLSKYTPPLIDQKTILFKASTLLDDYISINHTSNGWNRYNIQPIDCHEINASHETVLNEESSKKILAYLWPYLD